MDPCDDGLQPLPRLEVIKAIERKRPQRIPLVLAHWWGEGLVEQYGDKLKELDQYPEDVLFLFLPKFNVDKMNLSWEIRRGVSHDSGGVIDDWSKLDEFIEKLPDPALDPWFDDLKKQAPELLSQDRYILGGWSGLFFETPWALRGMQNLMLDFYEHPDKIHQLHTALCDHYCASIEKGLEALQIDGFWTTDDLGHQTQSMMRPETFDALLKPYYCRIGDLLQRKKVHWWLHSCGNNTLLLPSLIEAGVKMFHPVQKRTMDEVRISNEFGDRLGIWSGIDVQHTLLRGSSEDVRAEVRFLIDTFDREEGGMCIAAGNGIVAGTPFENIRAFLDEAIIYGRYHREKFADETTQ